MVCRRFQLKLVFPRPVLLLLSVCGREELQWAVGITFCDLSVQFYRETQRSEMWLGRGVGQICSSPQLRKEIAVFQFPETNNNHDQVRGDLHPERKHNIKKETRKEVVDTEADVQKTWRTVLPKGFLNLSAFILFLLHVRCSLWLIAATPPISLPSWRSVLPTRAAVPQLFLLLFPVQAIMVTLNVERFAMNGVVSSDLAALVHSTTIFSTFAIPMFYLRSETDIEGLAMNALVTLAYLVLALKLTSFVLVLRETREKQSEKEKQMENPVDLELKTFIFFWLSPSLVYRLNPIKNYKIKAGRVFIRVLEITALCLVSNALFLIISLTTFDFLEAFKSSDMFILVDR